MTRTDRELLADALKLIEYGIRGGEAHDITEKIRAHLAEKEDEPVAWSSVDGYVYRSYIVAKHSNHGKEPIPLYRHSRQLARLSDVEVSELMNNATGLVTYKGYKLFAEKIMDAMMEKNQ